MQFDRLNKKLEGISDASKKGKPVRDLFKIMTNCKEIWYEAYARIYSNKGAITKGANESTLDGLSLERVEKIIQALREKRYRFSPVRRTYIPKRSSNKRRPLGIPTGDDKMVQEVARILLERVYEPIFSSDSHGFRPKKSCHTALEQIRKEWTGIKWFIEFDIKGFYDNMDHEIMIQLLKRKIDDKRFIKLIGHMLKAGYLEDWRYHPTYSGAPQGGIASPVLSNIYLHELDVFMSGLSSQFTQGRRRRTNPEYKRLTNQMIRIRKEIDQVGKAPELMAELKALDRIQKTLPSKDQHDPGYKRLRYCRYCDDFLVGVIGTLDEAREIGVTIKAFLEEKLRLAIAEDKTGIHTGREGVEFLSYRISVIRDQKVMRIKRKGRYTRKRTIADCIRLSIPEDRPGRFCQKYGYGDWQRMKPIHRQSLCMASDVEIIHRYNAELRGFANYYSLAKDVKAKMGRLEYMANYSLFKTLAHKHKSRMAKVIAKLKRGDDFVYSYDVKGERRTVRVFRRKHMVSVPSTSATVDEIPNTYHLLSPKSELVKRLNAESCEYCGQSDVPLESHHVRKLKDLRKKPNLQKWEKIMIARNRKTLVICRKCHGLLHAGQLPDARYREVA
jgi:group II intron reverse transcriptase/maturase